MRIEFLGKGGETGMPGRLPALDALWWRRSGGLRLAPVTSAGCLAGLEGSGGPASADGEWSGRIEFGEEGKEEAAMALSLSESGDGAVGSSGMLAIEEDGERKLGDVSEDGELVLTDSSGEFLSGVGVELRGDLGRGFVNGEATVGSDGLFPGARASTELVSGPESLSDGFSLQREGGVGWSAAFWAHDDGGFRERRA